MAPVAGRTRAQVLERLRGKRSLPMQLGAPTPRAVLCFQDGRYRLRELSIDPGELEQARAAALAARRPFMAEHAQALMRPSGKVLFESTSFDELRQHVAEMEWQGAF